jgi:hypothetical protein
MQEIDRRGAVGFFGDQNHQFSFCRAGGILRAGVW